MWLTREEERILAGEEGEAKALALDVIVRVGESLGAQRLIPIKHAHVSGASYMTIGEAGARFIERLARMGARFEVPTTVNPISYDTHHPEEIPGGFRVDPRIVARQASIIDAFRSMGADLILTCTPYYTEAPAKAGLKIGDHVAWGESNAVAYANSVMGLRTNREGGPLALMAAIAGRTYYYGMHIAENRRPRVAYRVEVKRPLSDAEAGVLGEMIATLHREEGPPLVDAIIGREAPLKEFLAAIGSAGDLAMAYIPGVTPEDPGDLVSEVVFIEEGDLADALESRGPDGEIDLVYVGCPHSSLEELRELSLGLARVGARPRVPIIVSISGHLYWEAVREGIVERLSGYGVSFVRDTCLIVSPFPKMGRGLRVATNSYKAYFYLNKKGVKAFLAPISKLVEMSVAGR